MQPIATDVNRRPPRGQHRLLAAVFARTLENRVAAFVSALIAGSLISTAAPAEARDDPYKYDLRLAIFPVGLHGGVSQSGFGVGLRSEFDLSRRFSASIAGRVPLVFLAGDRETQAYAVRAGISWNLIDSIEVERLGGSVYPEDTPSVAERGGIEFDTPVADKLGGPRLALPDVVREARAPLRQVHALRLGYERMRVPERSRPEPANGTHLYVANAMHLLYVGYAWATHWNLSPATAGKREVGFRRFFVDLLATSRGLTSHELAKGQIAPAPRTRQSFVPIGGRLGMEGSIDALIRRAPALGFAYCIELGILPGTSGLEGYAFAGFGLEVDFDTHPRVTEF